GGSRGEKTLRTLNLATGLEGWGYRTPGDIRGNMALGGVPPREMVYFATDAGEVCCLPSAGADGPAPDVLWSTNVHGPVTAGLEVSGEELFVASEDGFLYCMDRITGIHRWAAPHQTPLTEAPVATAGSVYQFRTGGLWCHDRATGAVRWKLKGAVRFVLERDGKSVVQMEDGSLAAVAADGTVSGRLGHGGYAYPTNRRDANLYAVSGDGFVVKLEVGGE
ncbi:MAG: PQQ-like beta-propeller repeat protein, partial [Planctomycetes bacterium]|nr:PQQ-like beta-propeller repeat protein [Planctomycetota bacterium]